MKLTRPWHVSIVHTQYIHSTHTVHSNTASQMGGWYSVAKKRIVLGFVDPRSRDVTIVKGFSILNDNVYGINAVMWLVSCPTRAMVRGSVETRRVRSTVSSSMDTWTKRHDIKSYSEQWMERLCSPCKCCGPSAHRKIGDLLKENFISFTKSYNNLLRQRPLKRENPYPSSIAKWYVYSFKRQKVQSWMKISKEMSTFLYFQFWIGRWETDLSNWTRSSRRQQRKGSDHRGWRSESCKWWEWWW